MHTFDLHQCMQHQDRLIQKLNMVRKKLNHNLYLIFIVAMLTTRLYGGQNSLADRSTAFVQAEIFHQILDGLP